MNNEIIEELISLCKSTFPSHKGTIDARSFSHNVDGWDSMGHIIFIEAIEKKYNLSFDIMDMMEFDSIESIAIAIQSVSTD